MFRKSKLRAQIMDYISNNNITNQYPMTEQGTCTVHQKDKGRKLSLNWKIKKSGNIPPRILSMSEIKHGSSDIYRGFDIFVDDLSYHRDIDTNIHDYKSSLTSHHDKNGNLK